MTTAVTIEKQPLWFIANRAQVHVDGEESGGAFDLVEIAYVLEGRLSLHLPGSSVELGAGESFFAPRGVPHVYRVESAEARWLGVGNPAGFADFVREASDVATGDGYPPAEREPDVERVAEAAARRGIELLGPPGAMPGAS